MNPSILIRVVLDTNILISPLLKTMVNEAVVLDLFTAGRLTACYSERMMLECQDVLTRQKFGFEPTRLGRIFDSLRRHGLFVEEPAPPPNVSPDPSDTMFIAGAIASSAAFLVTGNRRHFPEPRCGTAGDVNARELLARLPAA